MILFCNNILIRILLIPAPPICSHECGLPYIPPTEGSTASEDRQHRSTEGRSLRVAPDCGTDMSVSTWFVNENANTRLLNWGDAWPWTSEFFLGASDMDTSYESRLMVRSGLPRSDPTHVFSKLDRSMVLRNDEDALRTARLQQEAQRIYEPGDHLCG